MLSCKVVDIGYPLPLFGKPRAGSTHSKSGSTIATPIRGLYERMPLHRDRETSQPSLVYCLLYPVHSQPEHRRCARNESGYLVPRLAPVLAAGLLVMAALAQRLPVIPVPELQALAPVRLDVVNDAGFHDQATLKTTDAQRVIHQVQPTRLAPVPVVAALVGARTVAVRLAPSSVVTLQVDVLQAVAVCRRVRATEGATGGRDQGGHYLTGSNFILSVFPIAGYSSFTGTGVHIVV